MTESVMLAEPKRNNLWVRASLSFSVKRELKIQMEPPQVVLVFVHDIDLPWKGSATTLWQVTQSGTLSLLLNSAVHVSHCWSILDERKMEKEELTCGGSGHGGSGHVR